MVIDVAVVSVLFQKPGLESYAFIHRLSFMASLDLLSHAKCSQGRHKGRIIDDGTSSD